MRSKGTATYLVHHLLMAPGLFEGLTDVVEDALTVQMVLLSAIALPPPLSPTTAATPILNSLALSTPS